MADGSPHAHPRHPHRTPTPHTAHRTPTPTTHTAHPHCPLPTAHCPLPTAHCHYCPACPLRATAHCPLPTAQATASCQPLPTATALCLCLCLCLRATWRVRVKLVPRATCHRAAPLAEPHLSGSRVRPLRKATQKAKRLCHRGPRAESESGVGALVPGPGAACMTTVMFFQSKVILYTVLAHARVVRTEN
jgi:hypothetical protein